MCYVSKTRAGDSLQQYFGVTLTSLDFRIICKNCNRQIHSALKVKEKKKQTFEEGRLECSNFVRRSVKRLALSSPNQIADQEQKVVRKPAKRYKLNFTGETVEAVGNENDPSGSLSLAEKIGTKRDAGVIVSKRYYWELCCVPAIYCPCQHCALLHIGRADP